MVEFEFNKTLNTFEKLAKILDKIDYNNLYK